MKNYDDYNNPKEAFIVWYNDLRTNLTNHKDHTDPFFIRLFKNETLTNKRKEVCTTLLNNIARAMRDKNSESQALMLLNAANTILPQIENAVAINDNHTLTYGRKDGLLTDDDGTLSPMLVNYKAALSDIISRLENRNTSTKTFTVLRNVFS